MATSHPVRAMLENFFARRKIKRTFSKVVDSNTVAALLSNEPLGPSSKAGRIDFVVLLVRGSEPVEVSTRLSVAAKLIAEHGAMVYNQAGPILFSAFREPAATGSITANRHALAAALHEHLGDCVKVVHGAAEGYSGALGGDGFMSFTFLIPHFDTVLGRLCQLEFGKVEEVLP